MPKLSFEELKALVLLNRVAFGGGRRVLELLETGTPPSAVLARMRAENFLGKAEVLEKTSRQFDPEKEIGRCHERGIRCLTYFDPDYPSNLREISDPPLVLYLAGEIAESDQAAVAIVGTRHPSFYGLEQAGRFGKELAREGMTIISGFAKGIDQEAHEGALEIPYGRTIAVLGCGLDIDYPRGSRKLFEQIKDRGAVISEYVLGTDPRAENFPRRNRIISGLSYGVLVVEAHTISGSLITAHEAADQGREVFAIPGPVDQLTSRGTHRLLKEGAYLAEDPADIIEVLAPVLWPLVAGKTTCHPEPNARHNEGGSVLWRKGFKAQDSSRFALRMTEEVLSEEEEKLTGILSEPLAHDEIAKRLSLAPGKLAASLLELELKKKIQKMPNGRFKLLSS